MFLFKSSSAGDRVCFSAPIPSYFRPEILWCHLSIKALLYVLFFQCQFSVLFSSMFIMGRRLNQIVSCYFLRLILVVKRFVEPVGVEQDFQSLMNILWAQAPPLLKAEDDLRFSGQFYFSILTYNSIQTGSTKLFGSNIP